MIKHFLPSKPLFPSLLLAVMLCASMGHARANKYFTKTDSDANVYVAPYVSDIDQVAILPFKAPTELVGTSVSDLFVTEMLRAGRYTLLERSQMAKVLSESELALSGLSAAQAVEVGQMIGADGVIIGTVIEYGTQAYRGHAYPVVSISVRLIDTKTSQVVWSADLARKAEKKRTALSGHARDVVHEMVAGLYQSWRKQKKNPNPRHRTAKKKNRRTAEENPNLYAPVGYSGDPAVAPEVPQGVEISDFGLREVTLRWDRPVDAPYRFQVERSLSEDGPFDILDRVSPAKRKYTDKGSRSEPLEDSTAYYYRILAVSENGVKSDPSPVLESLTAPPPDPPKEISIDAPSSRCVMLDWEASESQGVTKYLVERSIATGTIEYTIVEETKNTHFKDGGTERTDLKDNTVYLYRIQAINRVGSIGPLSEPVEVTTLPPPHAVADITADSGEVRCVPLAWSVHTDEDIIGYTVYRSTEKDGEYQELATLRGRLSTSYLDGRKNPGNLQDNTAYYYLVIARNDVGAESPDSEIIQAKTRDVPPVVAGFTGADDQAREVPLSWEESEDEKVTGYEIWRQDDEESEFVKIADLNGVYTTEYLDRGPRSRSDRGLGSLEDGKTYRYKIKAYNAAYALSDWSKEISITTKHAPETPTLAELSDDLPNQIELSWNPNPEDDISGYELQASSYPNRRFRDLSYIDSEKASGFSFAETDLNHAAKRYYRLRAVDEAGLTSQWSQVEFGQAKPQPAPPGEVAVDYLTGYAEISWDPSETEDVVSYRIYEKTGFTRWEEAAVTEDTTYSLTPESLGKKGTFAIVSVDKDELESERSTSVSVVSKLIPDGDVPEDVAEEIADQVAANEEEASGDYAEEVMR